MERDTLMIGGVEFNSRFILSSGKTGHYTNELIHSAIDDAGVEMISVALSHLNEEDNGLKQAPEGIKFLPTTLGARTLDDVIKMAHLSKDRGLGDFIKVEILHDLKYELPDNDATVEATRIRQRKALRYCPISIQIWCWLRNWLKRERWPLCHWHLHLVPARDCRPEILLRP